MLWVKREAGAPTRARPDRYSGAVSPETSRRRWSRSRRRPLRAPPLPRWPISAPGNSAARPSTPRLKTSGLTRPKCSMQPWHNRPMSWRPWVSAIAIMLSTRKSCRQSPHSPSSISSGHSRPLEIKKHPSLLSRSAFQHVQGAVELCLGFGERLVHHPHEFGAADLAGPFDERVPGRSGRAITPLLPPWRRRTRAPPGSSPSLAPPLFGTSRRRDILPPAARVFGKHIDKLEADKEKGIRTRLVLLGEEPPAIAYWA